MDRVEWSRCCHGMVGMDHAYVLMLGLKWRSSVDAGRVVAGALGAAAEYVAWLWWGLPSRGSR